MACFPCFSTGIGLTGQQVVGTLNLQANRIKIMQETVEKIHVLVAEQERLIRTLIAKDQVSSDDVNLLSFHLGVLFGVSATLRRVDVVQMTVSDKEQIIASIEYATESIKKEAYEDLERRKRGVMQTAEILRH